MTAEQARALALALAGSSEQPHFDLASFRVRGRIFATLTPDGRELRVFVKDEGARDAWLQREPEAIAPLFWGGKRAGLAVALAKARKPWLQELLTQAWKERA
jgi:predicted DNA-binding protein (MmcQ/YjbR family)